MTFGEKVLNARLALNFSQFELAEKIGVSERTIYSYEQTGALPRQPILKKLAAALNVTVAYLLDDDEIDKDKNIDFELFIVNAKNQYGSKGAREATELISRTQALFAGGELNDEAKDLFFQSLMEVYLESKAEAREKFAPKRKARRKKQAP